MLPSATRKKYGYTICHFSFVIYIFFVKKSYIGIFSVKKTAKKFRNGINSTVFLQKKVLSSDCPIRLEKSY